VEGRKVGVRGLGLNSIRAEPVVAAGSGDEGRIVPVVVVVVVAGARRVANKPV